MQASTVVDDTMNLDPGTYNLATALVEYVGRSAGRPYAPNDKAQ